MLHAVQTSLQYRTVLRGHAERLQSALSTADASEAVDLQKTVLISASLLLYFTSLSSEQYSSMHSAERISWESITV